MIKRIKKYWLLVIGLIFLIGSSILYFYLEQKWIGFISFMLGIIGIIMPLWQLYQENRTKKEYENIIKDYARKYKEEVDKSKKLNEEKEIINFEKTEFKKFLNKINETLQKENISKEELIKNISLSLKAIIFFKTSEDTSKKRFLIRNQVYPNMGVVCIRSGLSILPPKRVPQELPNNEIIKWFKKELEKRIPKNYEYNIPLISVVNLNETTSFKRLQSFRKIQLSYLDKIPIDELVPTIEIIDYLKVKKHLSPRDIIEIPNLSFLVEDYLISKSDLTILMEKNMEIINKVIKKTKSKEMKTTDFALIRINLLEEILEKYVLEPKKIAERIKKNASFWKEYFEHRLKND